MTPYRQLHTPPRDLCECGRGPKKAETEVCQHCEDDAQGDVAWWEKKSLWQKIDTEGER